MSGSFTTLLTQRTNPTKTQHHLRAFREFVTVVGHEGTTRLYRRIRPVAALLPGEADEGRRPGQLTLKVKRR